MPEVQKIRQFNAILTRLRLQDMKPELIFEASNGRTNSTKELNNDELNDLIDHLNSMQQSLQKDETVKKSIERQQADRMRKKILHYCHLMFWYIPGTQELDFNAIDQFCSDRGYLHKKLNKYSYQELPTLVSQFEQVYKHFLSKI